MSIGTISEPLPLLRQPESNIDMAKLMTVLQENSDYAAKVKEDPIALRHVQDAQYLTDPFYIANDETKLKLIEHLRRIKVME